MKMSKLQEEPTEQAKLADQAANLKDLQAQDHHLAEIMEEEMTHREQVSVLSCYAPPAGGGEGPEPRNSLLMGSDGTTTAGHKEIMRII